MEIADKAAADGHLFEPMQVDKPFLNYVFDTLPRRMTHMNKLLPEISLKPRARAPFQWDAAHDAEDRQMPFIHWAGATIRRWCERKFFSTIAHLR